VKALISIVCGVVLTVFSLPAPASAQEVHGNSKKIEVHFLTSVVLGTTTLEAGDYYFQCRVIDGEHYLVASSLNGGAEVARTRCKPETLTAKVPETEYRTRRVAGADVLTSVRIKGETVAHTVATP
jgi:hypothetical protein